MFARQMVIALAVVVAGTAGGQTVMMESRTLGSSVITLYAHPFLTEEELSTLRLVATNEQALALFVPDAQGFASLAVSPEDGFIRVGAPMASATAVGEMPDADAARAAALQACDGAKQGTRPCVTVLDVAPAP